MPSHEKSRRSLDLGLFSLFFDWQFESPNAFTLVKGRMLRAVIETRENTSSICSANRRDYALARQTFLDLQNGSYVLFLLVQFDSVASNHMLL